MWKLAAANDETLTQMQANQRKAEQEQRERAESEMKGPPVNIRIPFTFERREGVALCNGKRCRLTLKWGILRTLEEQTGKGKVIILQGMSARRSGTELRIEMKNGPQTFQFKDEKMCTEWYQAVQPCVRNWDIGQFYEVVVGNRTENIAIYPATHRATKTSVQLKKIGWAIDEYRNSFEYALMECELCETANHPNLQSATDILVGQESAYIIMPSVHGCVTSFNCMGNVKTVDQVRTLARQLLSGAEALHALGYVHNDMKGRNTQYIRNKDGSITFKHCDFGGIERMENGVIPWKSYSVTEDWYAAPEQSGMRNCIIRRSTTPKVDVYAIGCILAEYISNCTMQRKGAVKTLLKRSATLDPDFKLWNVADEDMKNFVRLLLEPDFKVRPTASQALKHAWVTAVKRSL